MYVFILDKTNKSVPWRTQLERNGTSAKGAMMSTRTHMVSCIIPTADRRDCVPAGDTEFSQQDYPNRELVILDDGRIDRDLAQLMRG